jgi:hypothetical protein
MLGPRRTAGAGCCGCVAENELQAVAANIARTGQRFRAERMDSPARNAISECGAECVPGSKLTPASVVRGQRVSCLMRSASWNVTNWEFTPDASSETGASLPIVRERSTSREWAGIAAIGGVVPAASALKQGRNEEARSTIGTTTRVVGFEEEVTKGPPTRRP